MFAGEGIVFSFFALFRFLGSRFLFRGEHIAYRQCRTRFNGRYFRGTQFYGGFLFPGVRGGDMCRGYRFIFRRRWRVLPDLRIGVLRLRGGGVEFFFRKRHLQATSEFAYKRQYFLSGRQGGRKMPVNLRRDYKVRAFFFEGSIPSEASLMSVISVRRRGFLDRRYSACACASMVSASTAASQSRRDACCE